MAYAQHTPTPAPLEEAITLLFCLIDGAYALLNPRGDRYGSLKKLSDSEVLTLVLFQQLRGVESERCLDLTPVGVLRCFWCSEGDRDLQSRA